MEWPFALVNGGFCFAAVLVGGCARQGGREASVLALFLLADWFLYILSWTPYRPAQLFGGFLDSKDLWAIMDALVGVFAVGIAFRFWWGWALWLSVILQELVHGGRWFGWYDFSTYTHWLDLIFLAQLALFFLVGGPGCVDRLHRFLGRWRISGRAPRSALSRDEAGAER